MSAIAATYVKPSLAVDDARRLHVPVSPEASRQLVLAVEFQSRDGRTTTAVGGGSTVEAAIDWARECCQGGTTWYAVNLNDLYGE